MFDRPRLEQALTVISGQRARFGDAVVQTAIEVLEERLSQLPSPMADRESGPNILEEQRKQVTVLFASLDGFTRLSETSRNTERLRQIDLLWRQIDETIHYHGGTVDKHMGDVIMGIFGTSLAREDDPERAVRCALALRDIVGEYFSANDSLLKPSPGTVAEPVIRIGINTGQVLLGQLGSDRGQTAIGDAVNVASRLKEASDESGIYISQDTYRLVLGSFQVESLGAITVKGRRTAVEVFRVVGSRPRLIFPGGHEVDGIEVPMIGRAGELALLKDALGRSRAKRSGGLILITGDAGLGKSRLAGEFLTGLDSDRVMVLQGRSDQRQSQVPYSLLRNLLQAHFDVDEHDRLMMIERKIAARLASALYTDVRRGRDATARRLARAIVRLVGLGKRDPIQPEVAETGAAAEQEKAISAIIEYFTAVARQTDAMVFIFEDLHWADENSLMVLERLYKASAGSPVMIIGLARSAFRDSRGDWPVTDDDEVVRIHLQPLSDAKCRELVLRVFRKLPQIPSALTDLIVHSTAGNPFYVEELIRVLIEDGVIVPNENGWLLRWREWTRLRVPATLTGVLQARLDRLPEVERIVLQQAAVIGDEFWAGAVQQINEASRYPYKPEQVTFALQELERRDIIYRTPATLLAGTQAYLFRHAVLREVAYESILLRDRSTYHLQAANWLENQIGERVEDYAAIIGQHYEQGGKAAHAAHLYNLAASRALDAYKVAIAALYYRKVTDLLGGLPQYLDMRLAAMDRLGALLARDGELVESLETYSEMHNAAEVDGNIQGRAAARIGQARIYYELGDDPRVLMMAGEAEQLARLTGAAAERVQALLLQGESAAKLGRTHEALAAALQAVERARSLGAVRDIAHGLFLLASLPSAVAQPQVAQDALAELAGLVDQLAGSGKEGDAAFVLSRMGGYALGQGRPAESIDYFERALAHARAAGDLDREAKVLRLMGVATCRVGEPAKGIIQLESAAGLAEGTGNRYLRLGCRLAMGEALLAQGHYVAAEATLWQVIATAEDGQHIGKWRQLPHAYRLLVEALERQGRRDEASLLDKMPGTG